MNSPSSFSNFQKSIETMVPFETTKMDVNNNNGSHQQSSSPSPQQRLSENFNNTNIEAHNSEDDCNNKFQTEIKISQYMPYCDQLRQTQQSIWKNLKENLCSAIITQGAMLQNWIHACDQ